MSEMYRLDLVIIEATTERGEAWSGGSDDVAAAVGRLNHVGIPVALLTSPPLASPPPDVGAINRYNSALHRGFADSGAQVDALLFCPHAPDDGDPSPRLLRSACRRFCTQPARTGVIAASGPLAMAAQRVGMKLVCLGSSPAASGDPTDVVTTLAEGVQRLLDLFATERTSS